MKLSFLSNPEISHDFFPFLELNQLENLRLGVLTNKERWKRLLEIGLGEKVHFTTSEEADFMLDPRLIPDQSFINFFWSQKCSITVKGNVVVKSNSSDKVGVYKKEILSINSKLDLLNKTSEVIAYDLKHLQPISDISSQITDNYTRVYNESNCFVSDGLDIKNATLNAEKGPIFIGENVSISEYAVIYGPAVIHNNCIIGPHAKLRGGCIIGKNSVVAGELKNVVVLGNSNKGHFGYLGDSIVGEYCNLGAGTSCSNLKNNFHDVKVYSSMFKTPVSSGLTKVGSFIGDFTTTAVNTVLNTGSTIGVMCNVFGSLLYPNYLPSFSWGVTGSYHPEKFKETAEALISHKAVSEAEKKHIINKLENYFLDTKDK